MSSFTTRAQFINGDFQTNGGNACNAGENWAIDTDPLNLCEITDIFSTGNFWIDLTPCGEFGNGTWIEQVISTIPGSCYSVTMDIGSYCGWDGSDAGIYLFVNGVQVGERIVNDVFSCLSGTVGWGTFTSDVFLVNTTSTTVRFVGEGRCSAISDPMLCAPLGGIGNPGVIGLDNIMLNLTSPAIVLSDDLSNVEICQNESVAIGFDSMLEYNYLWNTGDTTAQIIVSSAGQYTVAVTAACSMYRDTLDVEVYSFPQPIDLGDDQYFCEDFEILLDAGREVLWSSGQLTDTLRISSSGTYHATEENVCGVASDTIVVNHWQTPGESFVRDFRFCKGTEYVLTIPAVDAAWSTGEIGSEIAISNSGQYTAEASNECGQGTYTFNVVIADCDLEVFAPNAFTPDGDGINDFWMPIVNGDFDKMHWSIWNRWGELIASSTDALKPWSGDIKGGEFYAPDGVYTYVIYVLKDLEVKNEQGFLVLVR